MNKLISKKSTGRIGIIILFSFILGFLIFFLKINPDTYTLENGIYLGGNNIDGLTGLNWVKYFNYIGIGLLIIIFCIGLIYTTSNLGTLRFGKLLLLTSGVIWMSFGIFEMFDDESGFSALFLLLRTIIILSFGAIGFLLLANDFHKITDSIIYKRALYLIGFLIFLNGIADFIAIWNYPNVLGYLSWILYFTGFGFIGVSLIKTRIRE